MTPPGLAERINALLDLDRRRGINSPLNLYARPLGSGLSIGARPNIPLGMSNLSLNYNTGVNSPLKRFGFDYSSPSGASLGAGYTSDKDVSINYSSPRGREINVTYNPSGSADFNYTSPKGSEINASYSPSEVSAEYVSPSGIGFNAGYSKDNEYSLGYTSPNMSSIQGRYNPSGTIGLRYSSPGGKSIGFEYGHNSANAQYNTSSGNEFSASYDKEKGTEIGAKINIGKKKKRT